MLNFFRVLVRVFSAIVFVVSTTNCVEAQEIRYPEVEVIVAFVNHYGQSWSRGSSWIFEPKTAILSKASPQNASQSLKALIPEASPAVIADLARVGEISVSFYIPRNLVYDEVSFKMADGNSIKEIFDSGSLTKSWDHFYDIYPKSNGLTRFSRVGIDTKNKQALLYVESHCGRLCGAGHIVFLRHDSKRWKVIRSAQLWVS